MKWMTKPAIGLAIAAISWFALGSHGSSASSDAAMLIGRPNPATLAPRTLLAQPGAKGSVVFAVEFKPGTAGSRAAGRIAPRYISPSTQSLQIRTDGTNPVVINLTPTSPNCTPGPQGSGEYFCKAFLVVPAGKHVFTVTAYDEPQATGNALSTNSTPAVVVKPAGTTTIGLALEGLVRYFIVALQTTPIPGAPATVGVIAYARDADGNEIVGSAPYENPVTLTTSDPKNGALSKTELRSPADAVGLTMQYSGAPVSLRFSATATGLPPNNVFSTVVLAPETVTGYALPPSLQAGSHIAAGAGGSLWFFEAASGAYLGRITTGGRIFSYGPFSSPFYPSALTAGPSVAACRGPIWSAGCYEWMTFGGGGFDGYIGRLANDGKFTLYKIPEAPNDYGDSVLVSDITVGPDNAVWFTEVVGIAGFIGRVSPTGSITLYPLPPGNEPIGNGTGITTGPDGALWFTVANIVADPSCCSLLGYRIGRLTTTGRFTAYPLPAQERFDDAVSITRGPDGALWFSGNGVGRLTTSGIFTFFPPEQYNYPALSSYTITTGSDGALWFTQFAHSELGRVTTAGQVTEYLLPNGIAPEGYVTTGPDKALWFSTGNAIDRFAP